CSSLRSALYYGTSCKCRDHCQYSSTIVQFSHCDLGRLRSLYTSWEVVSYVLTPNDCALRCSAASSCFSFTLLLFDFSRARKNRHKGIDFGERSYVSSCATNDAS